MLTGLAAPPANRLTRGHVTESDVFIVLVVVAVIVDVVHEAVAERRSLGGAGLSTALCIGHGTVAVVEVALAHG